MSGFVCGRADGVSVHRTVAGGFILTDGDQSFAFDTVDDLGRYLDTRTDLGEVFRLALLDAVASYPKTFLMAEDLFRE